MSTPGPFEGGFEGLPLFGDLAKLFSSQGPVNWDVARQVASWMSVEGKPEANVDPLVRIRVEELARVAELHVADATGLATASAGRSVSVRVVGRAEWARDSLDAYRPLFERLASSMGQMNVPPEDLVDEEDAEGMEAMADLLGNFGQVLAPMMLGMQSGLMVGHLARRCLGQYDLPIPRPGRDELLLVAPNVDGFAKDWSLTEDDVRLWVCLDLITHHAVLTRPHVQERLQQLLFDYAGGFHADPSALESQLGELDPTDQASMERIFGNPDTLLGAIQTDDQRRLQPQLEALVAAVEGYVDVIMDRVGGKLIGSYNALTEALRRRRLERNDGDAFVERLFGLELTQRQYDRGSAFVEGIVERAGDEGLVRLWASAKELPTPAEVDAPGLWWERINLPD